MVYGDIHVMSYSLFEGFVSGQVPDQATKSGWLKKGAQSCSVSRVAASCMTPAPFVTAFHAACARHLRFTPRMRVALHELWSRSWTRTKGSRVFASRDSFAFAPLKSPFPLLRSPRGATLLDTSLDSMNETSVSFHSSLQWFLDSPSSSFHFVSPVKNSGT